MFRKRDTELIILEVLACQDDNDKESIQYLKEFDEEFSWKELGRYQNLAAALPLQLKSDLPSDLPKDLFVKKLNRLLFGKENISQPEKFIPGIKEIKQEKTEEKITQKTGWDSLSFSDIKSSQITGFEEVRAKTTSVKKIPQKPEHNEEEFREIEFPDFRDDGSLLALEEHKVSSNFRKLVFTSSVLFILIISFSVYLFFNNDTEIAQVTEQGPVMKTDLTVSNELLNEIADTITENFRADDSVLETTAAAEVKKVETSDKLKNNKGNLPKAPPKLPEPIEAPIITTRQAVDLEEAETEEKISLPPAKETIIENEEPTYFVAVEEMPQPVGGLKEIQKKIQYPEIAKRAGVEGKVFVKAYIDENGNVVNAEVIKGIGAGCDEAALDAILKTKFTPGKQRGRPVKVQVTVPVLFKL